jgi:beta-lactam-binding protein with PASTA domain
MRAILLVALAALAALAVDVPGNGTAPRATTTGVPDVRGMPHSEAVCALQAAGLRWRSGDERRTHARAECDDNSASAPDPPIRRQRPAPGTQVPRGTIVHLEDVCTLLRFARGGAACA